MTEPAEINLSDFKIIQTLHKNERNEIKLAQKLSDGKRVVLKQSALYDSVHGISKLAHENELLKELNTDSIPAVYDLISDGKTVTLVQEYFEGENLKKKIFEKKLSFAEILNIAVQLAGTLHYVHQKGIIHKDINPGNIIFTNDGKLKLLDFGISSNLNSETSEILKVEQIEGTLRYIAPEQTGRTAYSITQSSDLYSFGILLYELLTGKTPFDSVDPLEIIHFHLSRNPVPVGKITRDLPDGLEQVISKLLEKSPDDRYQTAAGLKSDLELIKKHYLMQKPLAGFKAGEDDFADHYTQGQKLYGRDLELEELFGYYTNLDKLKSALVLVAGYSGIGKSALIRHIKFPIIQNKGTFISGKFDQFKKDIPYYALIEAINEFIKNLFSEPEEKIIYWRNNILNVLGENAGLITEVIPLLTRIIGPQPPVSKLQPAEQETRFNMALLDFIYAFSSTKHPLVIFLDDLQWADLPSLNLVKRILENPREKSIMLLGAYRDNEVDKGHPLMITLKQIKESTGLIKEIHLKPLSEETTCLITGDSYGMNDVQAKELGKHIFRKTQGNPFFIHSLLKSLYDRKLVINEGKSWVWNQDEIDSLRYTDNVIDLMTEGIVVLPVTSQEVLKLGAVLGNTFRLADLASIMEKTKKEVYYSLLPAIKEGYLFSTDNTLRSVAMFSFSEDMESRDGKSIRFTFAHDKVQQAAYNLTCTSDLPALHVKIGRLLLQTKSEAKLQEDIFEVLNHFLIGPHLISGSAEKNKIPELCLVAGRKAKDSTSYNLGVNFLNMGKSFLGENSWDENYQLAYNVFFELGECEYLCGNHSKAEEYFKEILKRSKTRYDKLKVYYVHSSLYLKIGNTSESLRLGLEAARLYNIRFPRSKWAIQSAAMFAMIKYLYLFSTKYKDPGSVFNLKDCYDQEIIDLNKFLIDLATSAYQQDKNLMMLVIFKIIQYYLREGFTDASGWGFSGFSVVVLSLLKMQKKGFDLWDITQKLHQRTNSPLIKWRLSYTVLTFHNPWRVPIRNGYEKILETLKACILNGDHIFTGYTAALYLRSKIVAGDNLREILETSEDHLNLLKNEQGGMDFFEGYYQLTKALLCKTHENTWDDESFNGEKTLKRLFEEGNRTKLAFFLSSKLYLLYYQGKYLDAVKHSAMLDSYMDNVPGDLTEATHAFYTSLSIAACFNELSAKEKKASKKILRKNLRNMKHWANGCPENFSPHYFLLNAENFALKNQSGKALFWYEKSIRQAGLNKATYVEAIANERAAFVINRAGLHKQGQNYITETWRIYKKWGAEIKCRQLENAYPGLLKEIALKQPGVKAGTVTIKSVSSASAFDLASVLKASQTIASQVKYDDLLKNLLHITIENAGAEKGCLLLLKDNEVFLEAIGISGNPEIEILNSVPVNKSDQVPMSVINYCFRSAENVVLNDAQEEERFKADPYIRDNNVQSVLCMPVTTVGKTTGLLYLENNLLKGVFNTDRIELLQMLSGQIGISIENSILYENLEEKVRERTLEIEKTLFELKSAQAQLIQSEKMASLGELTAGIAHEIQNPLNFVNNFSEVSKELITEMNEELAIGNMQLAKEIAVDIGQNIEKINHHGKRASSIIKGMLEHSRTGTGKKELIDINALADEYLRLAYHGFKAKDQSFSVDFKTEFDKTLPKINVVPQDIGRVLLNLINNAFYAVAPPSSRSEFGTGSGGVIKKINPDYKPTVIVRTGSWNPPTGGRGAVISVSDNGPGIPSSIKDKIFQPFFTTKPTGQGTGLGLSLSYDIVKAHGGEIKVETKEGAGTAFTILLPFK